VCSSDLDGLRYLAGQQSAKLTTPLEYYEQNPLWDNPHFRSGDPANPGILEKYNLTEYISAVDIQTYIEGAKLYFNYNKNEIVAANEVYKYCYVYSLNEKRWHKITEQYKNIFSAYPHSYGLDADYEHIIDVSAEDTPLLDDQKTLLIQTNAFKLGTDKFERLRRLITRFDKSNDDKLGIYLFVSNDTKKWAWCDGQEITGARTSSNYLSCPSSVKYGMLVVAGRINTVNDCITHLSLEYTNRYDNKIR
jgi:hypothetical protein